MCDKISNADKLKIEEPIKLIENSKYFVNKTAVNETEIAVTLSLSNKFLKQLADVSEKYSLTFSTVLNSQIDYLQFNDSQRLETRLRVLIYEVKSKLKQIKGSQRQAYFEKSHSIAIFKNELQVVREQNFILDQLITENVELEAKCKDLFEKLQDEEDKKIILNKRTKFGNFYP